MPIVVDRQIDSIYGLWRAEFLYNIPVTNFCLTTGVSGSLMLKNGADYAANVFTWIFGFLYKM